MADMPDKVNEYSEVPAAKHFAVHAVFDEEHKQIIRWLEAEANEAVRRPDATVDGAGEHGRVLIERIRIGYGDRNIDVNRELLARASDGTLQKYVPNRGAIAAHRVLKWIALTAELLLGIGIWLLGEGTPVLILVAMMLALAGWLAGNGIGGLFGRRLAANLPPALGAPAPTSPYGDIVKVVIGYVTIIGLSYLRAAGEDTDGVIYIVGFTVLLAVLISIFEALHSFHHQKYEFLRRQMATAQRAYAIHRHADAINEYEMLFNNKVKQIMRDYSKLRSG